MSNTIVVATALEAQMGHRPRNGLHSRQNSALQAADNQIATTRISNARSSRIIKEAESDTDVDRSRDANDWSNGKDPATFETLVVAMSQPSDHHRSEINEPQLRPPQFGHPDAALSKVMLPLAYVQNSAGMTAEAAPKNAHAALTDAAAAADLRDFKFSELQTRDENEVSVLNSEGVSVEAGVNASSSVDALGLRSLMRRSGFRGSATLTAVESHFRPEAIVATMSAMGASQLDRAAAGQQGTNRRHGGDGPKIFSGNAQEHEEASPETRALDQNQKVLTGSGKSESRVGRDQRDGYGSQTNPPMRHLGAPSAAVGTSDTIDATAPLGVTASPSQQIGGEISNKLREIKFENQTDYVSVFADRPAIRSPVVRTLEISLDPAELGPVRVRMNLAGNNLKLDIETARVDTARLLTDDRDGLDRSLRDLGLELSNLSVFVTPGVAESRSPHESMQSVTADAQKAGEMGQGVPTSSGSLTQDERKQRERDQRPEPARPPDDTTPEISSQSTRGGGKTLYI